MKLLRPFVVLLGVIVLVGSSACRNPIDYALEEGVFGGEWKSLQDDLTITASGNDAVVVNFGTSPLGRNPSVFKVGDKYLRVVMKTGDSETEAEAEIAVADMDGENLTGISYVPGKVQVTGDQMVVTPSEGSPTFFARSRPSGNTGNNPGNNPGGSDGGTSMTDGGTADESWFLMGFVRVDPTLDCTGTNFDQMEEVGEVARVINAPRSTSYDAETDALEAEYQAQYPDTPSWRIWTFGNVESGRHLVVGEFFVQNSDPNCRSRLLTFSIADTYEEALAEAETASQQHAKPLVPGTFKEVMHLTR